MKRPNATEAEVLKEFPDAKIINSFANGCLKATNAINNKLMTAGIKVENEHLDYSAYWRQVDSIRKEIKEEKDESKKRELEEKLKKFEKENSVRDYGV
jgi:cyclopropane fatty-acyl-phospholipid synthase-like methyltransferase